MRQTQITVYRFSELPSNEAKQRVIDKAASLFGYSWATEAIESLTKLAERFGGKLTDYSIDFFQCGESYARFDMPESDEETISWNLGLLGTYDAETLRGHGECKLTGYWCDETAIDGFRMAFYRGERDLNRIMRAAFDSWLEDCQIDCANFYSFEEFGEHADANEMEFTANGTPFRENPYGSPV